MTNTHQIANRIIDSLKERDDQEIVKDGRKFFLFFGEDARDHAQRKHASLLANDALPMCGPTEYKGAWYFFL